jgi:UDP-N-acetylglucosamine 1-carboxyvinyltransferase
MRALGAEVELDCDHNIVRARADRLVGAEIYFDVVSVGATINIMLAASMAEGMTVLSNVAKEPHVVDVANFLNMMGASVKGAGTDVIRISGRPRLHGCDYAIIPDQIEAGTYLTAVAGTGGEVLIKNVIPKHLECITGKLTEMGVSIEDMEDSILVRRDGPLKKANVKTLPYPGFPTDMQPQITTILCLAEGTSVITEDVWDNRYKYVAELRRMGAQVQVDGRVAVIEGVDKLSGAPIKACDLRAGAAMVIAGLCAQGRTEVEDVRHVERGYEDFAGKLRGLGADIVKVAEKDSDEEDFSEILA